MSGPRFSEHDREVIADVAAFCSFDPELRKLTAVWIGDGWAMGTDAYRIDAREVDTDWSGAINPHTFQPVRFDQDFNRKRWNALRHSPRFEVTGCTISAETVPDVKTRRGRLRRVCLGCFAYSVEGNTWEATVPCACEAPLVSLPYLQQAVAHFDNPVRLRWEAGAPFSKAVRIDEDEHFHLLMTVRRSSTW